MENESNCTFWPCINKYYEYTRGWDACFTHCRQICTIQVGKTKNTNLMFEHFPERSFESRRKIGGFPQTETWDVRFVIKNYAVTKLASLSSLFLITHLYLQHRIFWAGFPMAPPPPSHTYAHTWSSWCKLLPLYIPCMQTSHIPSSGQAELVLTILFTLCWARLGSGWKCTNSFVQRFEICSKCIQFHF